MKINYKIFPTMNESFQENLKLRVLLKILLFIFLITTYSIDSTAQCTGGKWLILNSNPWGGAGDQNAMNSAFGAGNWSQGNYSINPNTLFSLSNCFIVLEGSESNNCAFTSFLTTNLSLIQNWVSSGGRLFINSAPNTCLGTFNMGFGGVVSTSHVLSNNVTVTAAGLITINAGPLLPTTGTMNGNSYGHATFTGGSRTTLITGLSGGSVLSYSNWGAGVVFFGGITQPIWHSPQPQATNTYTNIFHYVKNISLGCAPPIITCPSNITTNNSSGQCGANVTFAATATGTPTPTITYSVASGSFFPVGTTTVTATATNPCGAPTCTFTVTVVDNQNPSITVCAPNQDVNLNGSCQLIVPNLVAQSTATDNCTVTLTQSPLAGTALASSHNQTHTVTIRATDAAGNFVTCTTVLTGKDVTNPAITVCAPNQDVNLNGTCQLVVPNLVAQSTGTDNCTVTLTQSPLAGAALASSHNQTHTVTITATDAAGNFVTCTTTLTGKDVTNPVITVCAPNQDVNLNGTCQLVVPNLIAQSTGTDNCTVTLTQSPLAGTALASSHNQTHTVTITATDAAGNFVTCTTVLTGKDVTNPVITICAPNQDVNLNGTCQLIVPNLVAQSTATDNCTVTITQSPAAGTSLASSHNQTHNVVITATDAAGNFVTCTAVLTGKDVSNPVITVCAPNQDVNLNGTCQLIVSNLVAQSIATDNCTVTLSQSPVAGTPLSSSHNQTHNVVITATDAAGNFVTCTAVLTGKDVSNPVITVCAPNQDVNLNGTCQLIVPNLVAQSTASDNCTVTLSQSPAAGTSLASSHNQTHNVVITATDAAGNFVTCTAVLTGKDVTNPAITVCAPNQDVNLNGTCELVVPNLVAQSIATDNCTVTLTQTPTTGTALPSSHNQTHNVVITATDAAGNSVSCTTVLTGKDVNYPIITVCAPNQDVNLNGTCELVVPNLVAQSTATDNCTYTVTQSPAAGTVLASSHNQTHNVVINATDAAGNSVSCTTILTSKDITPPTVNCQGNITSNNDPGVCGAVINYIAPTATDNCWYVINQIAGLSSGSVFPVGTTVNIFVGYDQGGNTDTCSFSVTVADIELPTILNVPVDFSSCNPVNWVAPTITDNCPGVQITSTHIPGSNFPFGTTTVTYTATDAYNNVSTCSFDVTRLEESVAADNITSNRDFNNICIGDDISLTLNGGLLGEAAQWRWYTGSCGGTALPAFNGMTSITVAPLITTTYYARAEGTCNTTVCVQLTVIVSTGPPANGLLSITSTPPYGASGVTGVVTCTNVPGATFYRWTSILGHINAIWFNGQPGPVETTTNNVNIAFQLPQQNYQIRVVAGNACGRSNNASAHIRGTVPAATCLTGPVLACPSTTATYSVASCPIPGTNSYQWNILGGNAVITSGQGTPTVTVTFGAGFTTAQICVNGVTNFGLSGPATCLTVSNTTEAPGAITGEAAPCQSGLENYTIAAVTGASSYVWTTNIPGAVASGISTTGTVQFPAGPFSGQVCVQAVSSCGTSVASCFNVTSGAAGIPGPISGPVSGICGASNVNYALGTNDANSYNWILPAGVTLVSGGTSNSVNVNFATGLSGPLTITVEAFYNCGSATESIVVDGAPATPTITPATICAGTDELYFASSAGADNYTWTLTGADYEECTNGNCSQYYVIWSATGGTMSVTATNTCGTSAPFNLSTNCRVSTTGNMDTKVYPNPTSGSLTIEFTSYAGGQYNLTITDMAGRSFMTGDVKATSGLNQHSIDLGTANPGMYMLYLKDAKGDISVHKITVE